MATFYHSKCNSVVYLDISGGYNLLTTPGLNNQSLRLGVVELNQKSTTAPASFYCPACNCNIENKEITTDIIAACSICGKPFALKDVFKLQHAGGVYCKNCIDLLRKDGKIGEDENAIPLIKIITKIQLPRKGEIMEDVPEGLEVEPRRDR